MTRVIVSEKTLETNVTAEMLNIIRLLPGCARAFWIGMKQRQEARNGIDDLISNVPQGVHLALQFKAARPTPKNGNPFVFSLSEPQHGHLTRLAAVRPNAVLYVLPRLNTFDAVRKAAPNLLGETLTMAVSDLAFLAPGRHRIECWPSGVSVFSDEVEGVAKPARDAITSIFGDGALDQLLSHAELREWLDGMFNRERARPSAIGQRLRGFSTLCLPR